VVAPISEAQLVETYVLNQVHFQSLAASKAARVVTAAKGRTVVDFGSRREHGTPELDMAYKLVEYADKGRLKLLTRKLLYPGRKQTFRQVEKGQMVRDLIGRFDEVLPGEPLLQPLFRKNQRQTQIDGGGIPAASFSGN
jgi:nicotinic acid phosphoribosyltransferase